MYEIPSRVPFLHQYKKKSSIFSPVILSITYYRNPGTQNIHDQNIHDTLKDIFLKVLKISAMEKTYDVIYRSWYSLKIMVFPQDHGIPSRILGFLLKSIIRSIFLFVFLFFKYFKKNSKYEYK